MAEDWEVGWGLGVELAMKQAALLGGERQIYRHRGRDHDRLQSDSALSIGTSEWALFSCLYRISRLL